MFKPTRAADGFEFAEEVLRGPAHENAYGLQDRRGQSQAFQLVWAALAGVLVLFADQPTVDGYNPLLEMFWDPGIWRAPAHDRAVLVVSWLVTTLFCHCLLFALQKARQRDFKTE